MRREEKTNLKPVPFYYGHAMIDFDFWYGPHTLEWQYVKISRESTRKDEGDDDPFSTQYCPPPIDSDPQTKCWNMATLIC